MPMFDINCDPWMIVGIMLLSLPLLFSLHTCAVRRLRTHTIREGETLWEISRAYNVSMETILRINDVDDVSRLRPGEELLLPITAEPDSEVRRLAGGNTDSAGESSSESVEKQNSYQYESIPDTSLESESPGTEDFEFDPVWPVDGRLISRFEPGGGKTENGILIQAPEGDEVRAVESGEVRIAGPWEPVPELGNVVIIEHNSEGDFVSVYAHLEETYVSQYDEIGRGEEIGVVGSTGVAEDNVVYLEVRHDLEPRDPLLFLEESR